MRPFLFICAFLLYVFGQDIPMHVVETKSGERNQRH